MIAQMGVLERCAKKPRLGKSRNCDDIECIVMGVCLHSSPTHRDGFCDNYFNNELYGYDGGDCCGKDSELSSLDSTHYIYSHSLITICYQVGRAWSPNVASAVSRRHLVSTTSNKMGPVL